LSGGRVGGRRTVCFSIIIGWLMLDFPELFEPNRIVSGASLRCLVSCQALNFGLEGGGAQREA
jgi:hypothetical protein